MEAARHAPPEVAAARSLTAEALARLQASAAFAQLEPETRDALLRDLSRIRSALHGPSATAAPQAHRQTPPHPQPQARPLDTVATLRSRLGGGSPGAPSPNHAETPSPNGGVPGPKASATDTLARKAGALSDEIDFPAFVAGLVHGTFDAIVDAAIRQMEAFAELVSAVAKNVDDFTRDNVSSNQARDWLVQHYPKELVMDLSQVQTGEAVLRVRRTSEDDEPLSPTWLADFDLTGAELTDELVEQSLVPAARRRVGESRMQMLATMVLLGLNRIVVRDGSISARVRFRAVARDIAAVDYAASQDPGGNTSSWGSRGSNTYVGHDTKVSTVGVNVQAESELRAELFGEVKINFASETLPLERFVDQARVALLQRNARPVTQLVGAAPALATPAPTPAPAPLPIPAPAPAAPSPIPISPIPASPATP
jgi:hypothetical protein